MKAFILLIIFNLITLFAQAEIYTTSWVAFGDASQYANNWLTAKMGLTEVVQNRFKATASDKCTSLGGKLVDSQITKSEFFDMVTIYRYQVSGTVTCELKEEGICADAYNIKERDALLICTSIKDNVNRDVAAQCVINALKVANYRYYSFAEGRTHIMHYCIEATKMGFGIEMGNAALYQGSLKSHFDRLKNQ